MIIEKSKEKHIPKTTIKLNEKEENKTIISWNEMSIEDKLEVHIKNIMVDIKLKIEEGNKEIAIKNLQYYIKRLPNNYKAIKYENIINEKLNILNKLLEEISI